MRHIVFISAVCALAASSAVQAQISEPGAPERDAGPVAAPVMSSGPGLTQAAEAGDARAQYELAVAYANGEAGGRAGAPDYVQAARWFAEAARHGAAEAGRQLQFMVEIGVAPRELAAALTPSAGTPFQVQVASVASEADGPREWRRLQRLHPDVLGPLKASIVAFDGPDGAHLFRVQGGPLDEDGARAACAKLREAGAGCRIVRP